MTNWNCAACSKPLARHRVEVLNTHLCIECAGLVRSLKFDDSIGHKIKVKRSKVKTSKLLVSILRNDDPLRISMPFKRVNRAMMEIIRDGDYRVGFVPVSCLVNRVVDNNVASPNNLGDTRSEFYTSIPRSTNGHSGDGCDISNVGHNTCDIGL